MASLKLHTVGEVEPPKTGQLRVVPSRMTRTEFEAFGFPDDEKWELILGEPVLAASPWMGHQSLVHCLEVFLDKWVAATKAGLLVIPDCDYQARSTESQVRPDIMLLSDDEPAGHDVRPYLGTPRLICEVPSPSSRGRDLDDKLKVYQAEGVPEYWVADTSNGALFLIFKDGKGYHEAEATPDGFVYSPLLKLEVRIAVLPRKFEILSRKRASRKRK